MYGLEQSLAGPSLTHCTLNATTTAVNGDFMQVGPYIVAITFVGLHDSCIVLRNTLMQHLITFPWFSMYTYLTVAVSAFTVDRSSRYSRADTFALRRHEIRITATLPSTNIGEEDGYW